MSNTEDPQVVYDDESRPEKSSLLAQAMAGSNQGANAMARTLASRETAEALTSALVAKQFPRDEVVVLTEIRRACNRLGVARKAVYSYNRGGTNVTGPSIRLAQVIARAWGNNDSGWLDVGREFDPKKGVMVSTIRAYFKDHQTNTTFQRTFSVPHWRDTREGGYALKDERDIYELCANMAARRMRACILEGLPADIIDEAVWMCEATVKDDNKSRPLADRIRDMLIAYQELGVAKEMIAARLQHNTESMTEAEFIVLSRVYVSITDGYTTTEKEFVGLAKVPETKKTERQAEPEKKGKGKPKPDNSSPPAPEATKPAPVTPVEKAAAEADKKLPVIQALVNRAVLEGFDPNAFVDWAVRAKVEGIEDGKPIGIQPFDALIEIANFVDDAVNAILSAKKG